MRIESVGIKNFRAFKDCTIHFDDYTCLVGANGVGKSTVLAALNVFFGYQDGNATDVRNLADEDFFQKDTSEPIEIKVTFGDLSDEAREDFKHYVRGNKLIVTARAEFSESGAGIRQYGSRMGIGKFRPFFEAQSAKDKKAVYEDLSGSFTELPKWSSAAAGQEALNSFEQSHPDLCEELESKSQFYGFSKGANLLEKHIQWVYVPAVKDAATEELESKNTAFSKLLDRAVRSKVEFGDQIEDLRNSTLAQYQKLIEAENGALSELSSSLQERLQDWGNPRATVSIAWYQDPAKFKIEEPAARLKTGEQGFEGSLARIGHGLQRSYLISLLQELATLGDKNISTLVLGIEEPELYQHPPQAKHLAHVLQQLSDGNAQVLAATHSPYFVSGRGFENVRAIRRNAADQAYSCAAVYQQLADREAEIVGKAPQPPKGLRARLDTTLQPALSEMLFTDKLGHSASWTQSRRDYATTPGKAAIECWALLGRQRFTGGLRVQSVDLAAIRRDSAGHIDQMLMMREVYDLTGLRHAGQERQRFLRTVIIERFEDVVCNERQRRLRLRIFGVASDSKGQVQLRPRARG